MRTTNQLSAFVSVISSFFITFASYAQPLSLLPGSEGIQWTPETGLSSAEVKNDIFSGTMSALHAYIKPFMINTDAKEIPVLALSVKHDYCGDAGIAVYWNRSDELKLNESKKLYMPYSASTDWQMIYLPLKLCPEWRGTIKRLRLDFINQKGSVIKLCNVRFVRKLPADYSTVFPGSIQIEEAEGFNDFKVAGKSLCFQMEKTHALTRMIPMMFSAADYQYLKIKFKANETFIAQFMIYFGTLHNPKLSQKRLIQTRVAVKGELQTATLKLKKSPEWKGIIKSFRIDVIAEEDSSFQIESIKFANK